MPPKVIWNWPSQRERSDWASCLPHRRLNTRTHSQGAAGGYYVRARDMLNRARLVAPIDVSVVEYATRDEYKAALAGMTEVRAFALPHCDGVVTVYV